MDHESDAKEIYVLHIYKSGKHQGTCCNLDGNIFPIVVIPCEVRSTVVLSLLTCRKDIF